MITGVGGHETTSFCVIGNVSTSMELVIVFSELTGVVDWPAGFSVKQRRHAPKISRACNVSLNKQKVYLWLHM